MASMMQNVLYYPLAETAGVTWRQENESRHAKTCSCHSHVRDNVTNMLVYKLDILFLLRIFAGEIMKLSNTWIQRTENIFLPLS